VNLYVIYDMVAEESGPVLEAKNDGVAARQFREVLSKSKCSPGEMKLLRLGSIDHQTQTVRLEDVPEEVSIG